MQETKEFTQQQVEDLVRDVQLRVVDGYRNLLLQVAKDIYENRGYKVKGLPNQTGEYRKGNKQGQLDLVSRLLETTNQHIEAIRAEAQAAAIARAQEGAQ